MKRIDNTDIWTDGVVKYIKNDAGDFERWDDSEDNWTYSEDDFVKLDEEIVLKPVDKEQE